MALSLLAAPSVALGQAAVDEYSLDTPSAQDLEERDVQQETDEGEAAPAAETLGVVGENSVTESPLDSAGQVPRTGTLILLGVGAALLIVLLVRLPRRSGTV